MPYMKLLGHFKDPWKIKVRDLIIQRVRMRCWLPPWNCLSGPPKGMRVTGATLSPRLHLESTLLELLPCPSYRCTEVIAVQVLKHLTVKRPLEAVRTDFFAQVGIRHPAS